MKTPINLIVIKIKGVMFSILVILISILSYCKKEVVPIVPIIESFKVSATIANTNSNLDIKGSATDTIKLKNDSSSIIRASLSANISNSNLIDSFFIDGMKIDILNGRFIFSKTLPANSTTTVNFKYVLKANLTPQQSENGIVSTLTIDSISYNGFSQRVPVSANLFTLLLKATAFVDLMASVGKIQTDDSIVIGKSTANPARLNITIAGTALVEIIGLRSDNSLPISHLWITNSTDEDFGVRTSSFNVSKIPITSRTFSINLVAGVNNIVFKTTNLYRAIPVGTRVGLKITLANGNSFTSTYRVEREEQDLADKIVIKNVWVGIESISSNTERRDLVWCYFYVYPQNSDGSFTNNFPAIMSMGISTEYYARTYPLLDFSNRGNKKFYFIGPDLTLPIYILPRNQSFSFNKLNNLIIIKNSPFKLRRNLSDRNDCTLSFYLNIYNGDIVNFPKPPTNSATLFPAKGDWKFYGNPEMEILVDNELSQVVRLY